MDGYSPSVAEIARPRDRCGHRFVQTESSKRQVIRTSLRASSLRAPQRRRLFRVGLDRDRYRSRQIIAQIERRRRASRSSRRSTITRLSPQSSSLWDYLSTIGGHDLWRSFLHLQSWQRPGSHRNHCAVGGRIIICNIRGEPLANDVGGEQALNIGKAGQIAQKVAPSPGSPISSVTSAHDVTRQGSRPNPHPIILLF
jgi:hypothetical protein